MILTYENWVSTLWGRLALFVAIPAFFNLLLIGLYYSGQPELQSIVAPQIEWMHHRSWREFGLLEMLQNLFLLTIVVLFFYAVWQREVRLEKLFFLVGALIMLFLLLEEIDYGIHYYEYVTGQEASVDNQARNLHNRQIDGESVGSRLKRWANLVMIVWFLLLPLLNTRISMGPLSYLIPSRWFILGFVLSMLFSSLAHYLDDQGLDLINGMEGALKRNVSEFREASTYYLYLLYALQLVTTPRLFPTNERETQAGA